MTSKVKTKAATAEQTEVYFLRRTDQGWQLLNLEIRDEVILEMTATEIG